MAHSNPEPKLQSEFSTNNFYDLYVEYHKKSLDTGFTRIKAATIFGFFGA